jgi:5-deoxy-5-amino-3-dehydroquinate synthase
MTDVDLGPGSARSSAGGHEAPRRIPVDLGSRRYEVLVGPGARRMLAEVLPAAAKKVVVVTQPSVGVEVEPGVPATVIELPDGEQAKTLANVEMLCRAFVDASLSRDDAIVAVGGGVTTDVAGLAAALYHRGIGYVNVATTLLGQVDAAIGGKTGANLPEGKNLVGAFWQPAAVICDTEVLGTLPERELASGRGEMAKYAFLGSDPPGTSLLDFPIDEQVARCVEIKVAVVTSDERESDRRVLLNYGHTLAHALEAASFGTAGRFSDEAGRLKHGEAVAVGLVFAAELARRMGRVDDERVDLHRRVVRGFGLSYDMPSGARASDLVALMARDKKARADLSFVLDGPHGVELVRGVDPGVVADTLVEMGCGR